MSNNYPDFEELLWAYTQKADDEILAMLAALPILPDENDLRWWEGENAQLWHLTEQLLALAQVAGMRRLKAALPLVFERMSYGDPGETMRALKNPIEEMIHSDWDGLTEICLQIAQSSPHKGARLWAVAELGRLRDERTFPVLLKALQEPHEYIVCQAVSAVQMLCQAHPNLRPSIITALKDLVRTWQFGRGEWCSVQSLLRDIDEIQAQGRN